MSQSTITVVAPQPAQRFGKIGSCSEAFASLPQGHISTDKSWASPDPDVTKLMDDMTPAMRAGASQEPTLHRQRDTHATQRVTPRRRYPGQFEAQKRPSSGAQRLRRCPDYQLANFVYFLALAELQKLRHFREAVEIFTTEMLALCIRGKAWSYSGVIP
ncbi:hypothetical protein BBP40_009796 [Aspergillus hancockii]|nr:hypothetical protein BBP40_009796 [Aspergillus hancockii]